MSEIIRTGCCQFCGQQQDISLQGIATEAEANDYATRHCDCGKSLYASSLANATVQIDDVFSAFGAPVRELLHQMAKCILAGLLDKCAVQLDAQTKATLQLKTKNDEEKLEIKKTVTENTTATI